jgi:hypothetical protein
MGMRGHNERVRQEAPRILSDYFEACGGVRRQ